MALEHITLAKVTKIALSIAPLAPTSIIDAVSGYVTILTNYSPLAPGDDAIQLAFTICLKFLDECYNGASPRDVFMDIIHSMSNDLLQPFPEYRSVYDVDLRGELIKELSFRWQLFTNVSHHIPCKQPEMTVQDLKSYYEDLDCCNISTSDESSVSDAHCDASDDSVLDAPDVLLDETPEVSFSQDEDLAATQLPALECSDLPQNILPPIAAVSEYVPSPAPVGNRLIVADITKSSNGSNTSRITTESKPLSFYRVFYANWKNCLRNKAENTGIYKFTAVKLLLFEGRKPRWKKLSRYDVTIPWRERM